MTAAQPLDLLDMLAMADPDSVPLAVDRLAAASAAQPAREAAENSPHSDPEPPEPGGRSKGTGESAEGRTEATYVCETSGRTYRYGGNGGEAWHWRRGETACGPCGESRREHARRLRRKAGAKPVNMNTDIWSDCETTGKRHRGKGGYSRHLQRRDKPCEPCLAAKRAVDERERRKAGVKPRTAAEGEPGTYRCTSGRCYREGTKTGAEAHRARGEEVCPPCRKAERDAKLRWLKANPERGKEHSRRYRAAHPENQRESERRWREANPDKVRANRARYRARQRDAFIEDVSYSEVPKRDNGICYLCGEPVDPASAAPDPGSGTVDHLLALVKGGWHAYWNVALAHWGCNSRKQHRLWCYSHVWLLLRDSAIEAAVRRIRGRRGATGIKGWQRLAEPSAPQPDTVQFDLAAGGPAEAAAQRISSTRPSAGAAFAELVEKERG